jgi:hypothetical protein
MATLGKILSELEIVVESRAQASMSQHGATGSIAYSKAVDHEIDVLGKAIRKLMDLVDRRAKGANQ